MIESPVIGIVGSQGAYGRWLGRFFRDQMGLRVVGRDHVETVHVLLGDEAMRASSGFTAFEKAHLAVIAAYYAQNWDLAAELNDANEQAAGTFELTKLVMLYRDRIAAFAANPPPAGWDGVYEASSK